MTDSKTSQDDQVLVETTIAAPPKAVWKALTEQIGAWWPEAFYTGGEAGARRYTLEARPGGRMMEEWDDGGGLLWGHVCTAMPAQKLQVSSVTFPEWGGPMVGFFTWEIEEVEGGSKLRFTERMLRQTAEPDAYVADRQKGWSFLFDRALKAHAEGRPAPEWRE